MKTWPLKQAKNHFNQLVELAREEGPQTVTWHGTPLAVIISPDQFKAMARPKESPVEFLAPLRGSGVRVSRRRDLPRKSRP